MNKSVLRRVPRSGNGRAAGVELLRLVLMCLVVAAFTAPVGARDNVRVTGALVSGPCALKTTDIGVDIGQVSAYTLYRLASHRTAGTPFDIVLEYCTPGVAHDVKVTIVGTESAALPGRLLLPHRGLALGIETPDGQLLPVGKKSLPFPLIPGETVLHLAGFIQAEPEAVARKRIVVGPIDATAIFRVDYP